MWFQSYIIATIADSSASASQSPPHQIYGVEGCYSVEVNYSQIEFAMNLRQL